MKEERNIITIDEYGRLNLPTDIHTVWMSDVHLKNGQREQQLETVKPDASDGFVRNHIHIIGVRECERTAPV